MKIFRIALIAIFTIAFCTTIVGQHKMVGTVIEVKDGRTVVLDLQTVKINAVLQHIEVPEPGQQLHATVREHLEKLVLGKTVTFRPHLIMSLRTMGQLEVDGVDISEQLVRDGAAWVMPLSDPAQETAAHAVYRRAEALARSDKRGIWTVPNLKPAWEYRAEMAAKQRQASSTSTDQGITRVASSARGLPRQKPNAGSSVGALLSGYDPVQKTGYIAIPMLRIRDQENRFHEPMGMGIAYEYKEGPNKQRVGNFIIAIDHHKRDWSVIGSKGMVLVIDDQKISIGKGKLVDSYRGAPGRERLMFTVTREMLEKFANAREAFLASGDYYLHTTTGGQMLIYNLLEAAK
jgi:endonuclease YncB( thermonuclease family)